MLYFSVQLIKLYKIFFAWKQPTCLFNPTCSQYALQALNKYGFWKGWFLTAKRICNCHPFSRKNYIDPLL